MKKQKFCMILGLGLALVVTLFFAGCNDGNGGTVATKKVIGTLEDGTTVEIYPFVRDDNASLPPTVPLNKTVKAKVKVKKGSQDVTFPQGREVEIDIWTDPNEAGGGSAQIVAGSPFRISESGTFEFDVKGTSQNGISGTNSPLTGKLHLRARLAVAPEKVVIGPGFGVCAHLTNFSKVSGTVEGCGFLRFKYRWQSDSGSISDLNKVSSYEIVTYEGLTETNQLVQPPWRAYLLDNPTFKFVNADHVEPGTPDGYGSAKDDHTTAGPVSNGPENSFTAKQKYKWICYRCMAGPATDVSKGITVMQPTITRSVFEDEGVWKVKIEKDGVVSTCPASSFPAPLP